MTNPAYRKAAFALMMQEQAPTLSMPEGTDLNAYATLLIERFSNPSLRHRTGRLRWTAARNCRSACWIRCVCICKMAAAGATALGIAGWMRYTNGVDEQGQVIDVVDPMQAEFQRINQQFQGPNV